MCCADEDMDVAPEHILAVRQRFCPVTGVRSEEQTDECGQDASGGAAAGGGGGRSPEGPILCIENFVFRRPPAVQVLALQDGPGARRGAGDGHTSMDG